jgi:hypothetical protein
MKSGKLTLCESAFWAPTGKAMWRCRCVCGRYKHVTETYFLHPARHRCACDVERSATNVLLAEVMSAPSRSEAPSCLLRVPKIARLRLDRLCGVYFLCDRHRVLYVGQSINVFGRIQAHAIEARVPFDRVFFVQMPEGELNEREKKFIHRFHPKFNTKPGVYAERKPRRPTPWRKTQMQFLNFLNAKTEGGNECESLSISTSAD